jgi:hypothetical protein
MSVAKRQVLEDTIGVRWIYHTDVSERAAPFGTFRSHQVPLAGASG